MDAHEQHPWGDDRAALEGFEQQSVLVAVLEGPEHRLTALNAKARELLGDRAVLGPPLPESVPELVTQQWLDHWDEAYRTGEPYAGREWRLSLDGEGETETHYLSFRVVPWFGVDGTVCGLLFQGYDVTDEVLGRVHSLHDAERAREIVTAMQDALLPVNLPLAPGLEVGATYLLGAGEEIAGGDWFDAVVRPSGRVALVVGDAVGRGTAAVALMGQLRAVLHERLLSGAPLAEALDGVERFTRVTEGAPAATLCIAEVDRASGRVDYCTAGHPPPLSVGTDGVPRFWDPSGTGPLGTGSEFSVHTDGLAPDEMLVLYTDGLVHRPGRTVGQSTIELVRVLGDTYTRRTGLGSDDDVDVDRVCKVSLELLTRATGYTDDITLLAARRTSVPEEFVCEMETGPTAASRVRELLRTWLDQFGVRLMDEIVIQHAVGELVANVVDHAYGGQRGPLTVHARVDPAGELVATVSDRGRWRAGPPEPSRGNGLAMARGFSDRLVVDTGPEGTSVRLHTALKRPAHLLAGHTTTDGASPTGRRAPGTVRLAEDWIVAVGDLDDSDVDEMRSGALRITQGGVRGVAIDLRRVTHLSSCLVQLLHELHQELGRGLRLLAPLGSVAQHVLELVRLPYESEADDAPSVTA